MPSIHQILCPVDFSDGSRRALDHALGLAHWHGARVTALHVSPMEGLPVRPFAGPVVPEPITLAPSDRARLVAELRAFVTREAEESAMVEDVLAEGNPTEEIVARADAMRADLIVMGTYGGHAFGRLVLGSVTERVLRVAMCPVLTIPSHAPDAVPVGPKLYASVLCAVDFSDPSLSALSYALSFAAEAGARLTVLHVQERHVERLLPPFEHEYYDVTEYLEEYEQTALRRLAEAAAALRSPAEIRPIVAVGKPWREILRAADNVAADLITIGVHGPGAFNRFFFGSTASHVVRQAACPVLTLRA